MPHRSGVEELFFSTWNELGSVPALRFLDTLRASLSIHQGFLGVLSARAQLGSESGPVGGPGFGRRCWQLRQQRAAPCGFHSVAPGPAAWAPGAGVPRLGCVLRSSRACLCSPRPLSFPLPPGRGGWPPL